MESLVPMLCVGTWLNKMTDHAYEENPVPDDELARIADDTFLELDRREEESDTIERQAGAGDSPAR
jgi:hypothetical protein